MPTVERVVEGLSLGEGPHWDIPSQSLYFVDIFGKKLYKYVPATKKVTKVSLDKQPSFIVPVEGKKNEFIISLDNELVIISWDGESDKVTIKQKLATVETTPEAPKNFNDAKSDSSGRLWAGAHSLASDVMKSEPLGTLYSLDSKLQLKPHVDKIRIANGLAFNDKAKKLFYIDSLALTVDRFDFDIKGGTISNRQNWFSLNKFSIPGIPDGMTIDTDGNLWVAIFGGSRVVKVDGNKAETLLETIDIPALQVTSVAFGGKNLDELYVTSGAIEFEGKTFSAPVHGATYKVTGTGVKGLPASNFKLN